MGKCVPLEFLCKYLGSTLPKREEGTAAISRLSGSCHAQKSGVKITFWKTEVSEEGGWSEWGLWTDQHTESWDTDAAKKKRGKGLLKAADSNQPYLSFHTVFSSLISICIFYTSLSLSDLTERRTEIYFVLHIKLLLLNLGVLKVWIKHNIFLLGKITVNEAISKLMLFKQSISLPPNWRFQD